MDTTLKIVNFDQYCSTCKNKGVDEGEDPCNSCLYEPVNEDSHKPVNWKEK